VPRQEMRDGGARELPSHDGRALEHRPLLGTQPLDARREQRLDRRRHLDVRQLDARRPPIAFALERAVGDEHADELANEEGIALARPARAAAARRAPAAGRRAAPMPPGGGGGGAPASPPATAPPSAASPAGTVSDERDSRSSGRAAASTSNGTSVLHWIRCSVRSSRSGSAQWRSSIASTTGCVVASAERKRRMTKNVSSGDDGVPPSRAAIPPARRLRSASSPGSPASI